MGSNFLLDDSEWGAIRALWGEISREPLQPPKAPANRTRTKGADEHEVVLRERELVATYLAWAKHRGFEFKQEYSLNTKPRFRCDLYESSKGILIEAKGAVTRENLRMAIGELLDYKRFIKPEPTLALLLPGPLGENEDLLTVLSNLGIQLVWETPEFSFSDSAEGLLGGRIPS